MRRRARSGATLVIAAGLLAAALGARPSLQVRRPTAAPVRQGSGRDSLRPKAAPSRVELLRAAAAIPAEIVGEFREPAAFAQTDGGQYFVFDRRGHAVYGIDRDRRAAWKVVGIGHEPGRIFEPVAFALEPVLSTFIVVDQLEGRLRVQRFGIGGARIGGFYMARTRAAVLVVGGTALNATGAIAYTGHSLLVSQPESGSLMTEYGMAGEVLRSIGALRDTGHEADPEVHQALNAGTPLVTSRGEYYFVFQTGAPAFRKYDAAGRLVFERHIEGPELDPLIQALPNRWTRRRSGDGAEIPIVPTLVRAAAVDPADNLWVSLAVPFTYVFNGQGERARVVQFRAAGLTSPTSLSFAAGGRLLVTPGCSEFPWQGSR